MGVRGGGARNPPGGQGDARLEKTGDNWPVRSVVRISLSRFAHGGHVFRSGSQMLQDLSYRKLDIRKYGILIVICDTISK